MKNIRGFTLVELMVVLTVIGLLLSVVVPDYVGRLKRAEEAVLKENLVVMRDEPRALVRFGRGMKSHSVWSAWPLTPLFPNTP